MKGSKKESRVTIQHETKPSKKRVSFVRTIVFRATEARIEDRRNDVGKKAYNEKRSEPVPLERGRCMSGFLP